MSLVDLKTFPSLSAARSVSSLEKQESVFFFPFFEFPPFHLICTVTFFWTSPNQGFQSFRSSSLRNSYDILPSLQGEFWITFPSLLRFFSKSRQDFVFFPNSSRSVLFPFFFFPEPPPPLPFLPCNAEEINTSFFFFDTERIGIQGCSSAPPLPSKSSPSIMAVRERDYFPLPKVSVPFSLCAESGPTFLCRFGKGTTPCKS